MDQHKNLAEQLLVWRRYPEIFCRDVIGFGRCGCQAGGKPCQLDHNQAKILNSIGELANANTKLAEGIELAEKELELTKKKGVSVQAGKGVGKTTTAALVAIWFLVCYDYPRVIILGPSYDQIKTNLWPEITTWIRHSIEVNGDDSILAEILDIRADNIFQKQVKEASKGKEWGIEIKTFPKNASQDEQKAAVSGAHRKNMLHILDESSGIPDHIFETVDSTHTKENNIIFSIFNPNKPNGWAIETQTRMKDSWITHRINAENSDLVTKDQIKYLKDKYGEDSMQYRVYVLGLPPIWSEDTLIPWEWIKAAQDRYFDYDPPEDTPMVFGVDIGGGGDRTVLCRNIGNKILPFEVKNTENTDTITNWLISVLMNEDPEYTFLDYVAIGSGVYYRLRGLQFNVKGINVGNRSSNPNKFKRLRDELLWRLREHFEQGTIAIPPDDDELEGELSLFKIDRTEDGVMKMVSKKDSSFRKEMKARVGYKSPDKTDAVLLSLYYNPEVVIRKKQQLANAVSPMSLLLEGTSWMGS